MTSPAHSDCFAVLVQDGPYRQRSPRADLDVVLAAAALDFHVDVYFLGLSVLQLADRHDAKSAGLPEGYRAWAALPELGSGAVFAESHRIDLLERQGVRWLMKPSPLDEETMKRRWRIANRVWLL